MKDFRGKIAVITGGGTGMGRELSRQLSAEGCHVAMCDMSEESMAQTRALCEQKAPKGTRVTTYLADVSVASQVSAFRDAVAREHGTEHVNLVFNNAGIGGGGSFIQGPLDEWEKTFDVCWRGVYLCSRAFVPMLIRSSEGHLINTSSVNGFWATIGPQMAHTAYSAAKFAVKGFTEALINDFRLHAPHVKVSLVMPGHIGTSIVSNSSRILGRDPKEMSDEALEAQRERMGLLGIPEGTTGAEIRQFLLAAADAFRDNAPLTAAQAASIILDGVRQNRWRILVGDDALALDRLVRENPEEAYEASFMEKILAEIPWNLGN
jgi:hypothetical protein